MKSSMAWFRGGTRFSNFTGLRALPGILFFLFLAAWGLTTSPVFAKTVVLEAGESYNQGDLNILCVQSKEANLIEQTECQYWDNFSNRCLFEKKILSYGDLQCVEQCQHWDNFENRCLFATTCTFYQDQRAFVLTSCDKFDTFQNRCIRTKQTKITGTWQRKEYDRH